MAFTSSCHEILGVGKNASQEEIRKAFLAKSRIHHPDKPTGDNEMMQMLNTAYTELLQTAKPGRWIGVKTLRNELEMTAALFAMLDGDGFKNPEVVMSAKFVFAFIGY